MRNVFFFGFASSSWANQKRRDQNNIIKYLFIYSFGQQQQRFECNNKQRPLRCIGASSLQLAASISTSTSTSASTSGALCCHNCSFCWLLLRQPCAKFSKTLSLVFVAVVSTSHQKIKTNFEKNTKPTNRKPKNSKKKNRNRQKQLCCNFANNNWSWR